MKYQSKILVAAILFISLFFSKSNYASGFSNNPILVLATDHNFGSYTGEILKTEGFNAFQMDSVSDVKITLKYLKNFDVVILTETALTTEQKNMLAEYVKEGGSLIAFRPDKKLSNVFGISDVKGTLREAYLGINSNTEIGKGITSQTLQFHGEADEYKMNGGKIIASLFTDAVTASEFPAVVINNYGKGHALAFLYNLPKSIVHTRQGNYQNAGQEMDGITGIRAMDLFTNGWVDPSKNTLNQADEQMRLLTHGIEKMSNKPLPRFWYFPDTLKCLVTLTNDGEDSKEASFETQFVDVDAKGAKMTLYIKETEFVSKEWVEKWVNKGFEISGHPDNTKQAVNPDWNTMDNVYKTLINKLNSKYGISSMHTVTNHWFVWTGKNVDDMPDFSIQAQIEENNGIGLDCNYAHYDNNSSQGHFLGERGMNQGNYTGSGLTMKFANAQGRLINVYQHLNNVYDQQYMENKDPDGYFNCFKGLMDRSLNNEVYSYISVKAHNDEYHFSKVPLMNMLDYANSKHIPVWTAHKLLDFLKAKEDAAFKNIRWSQNKLSFSIQSTLAHTNGLTTLIPHLYNGKKISKITVNGLPQAYSVRSVKGYDYAMFTVKPGLGYNLEISYIN